MRYGMFISPLVGYNQGPECVKTCFSLTYIYAPFDLANQCYFRMCELSYALLSGTFNSQVLIDTNRS